MKPRYTDGIIGLLYTQNIYLALILRKERKMAWKRLAMALLGTKMVRSYF